MEKTETKRQIGLWLDKKEALVVLIENGRESLKNVTSNLEFFNPKGGSRSKTRWGPQDVVQDSKYLEREKHQLKRYFEKIVNQINKADAIALYGPAETYLKLEQELKDHHPKLHKKVVAVNASHRMTENQFTAKVREFFSNS